MTQDNRIFKPMASLEARIARLEAARHDPNDKFAALYMSADQMREWYGSIRANMKLVKALTPDEAAARLGVASDEVRAMAMRGEIIACEFEGRTLVPDYQFTALGPVDPMVLDLAREFVRENRCSEPDFLSFSKFMTNQKTDVSKLVQDTVAPLLDEAAAGLRQKFGSSCQVKASIRLSVVELLHRRGDYPVFRDIAIGALLKQILPPGNAMAGPAEVFLSDDFKKKYGLNEQGICRMYGLTLA